MVEFCTSCGKKILAPSIVYKCQQCSRHFLCESCLNLDRNRAYKKDHTFEKESGASLLLPDTLKTIYRTKEESPQASSDRPDQQKVSRCIYDTTILFVSNESSIF